ncbi:unnamed protein product [Cyclocybe aegerita]|uniref:Uncharacterized protein n=1 Tax=Cyclocybe aegerita TaxID=1973307 RepID=A0A8S0X3D4_CYCAE|nr:unnamed protein product [Cyclocybe aegerita]
MTLLGGLFSRKHKSSPRSKRDDNAPQSLRSNSEDLESSLSSPTASSYSTPDRSLPSHPNGRTLLHPDSARQPHSYNGYSPPLPPVPSPPHAGGGKLRLFGRKKSNMSGSDSNTTTSPDLSSDGYSSTRQPIYPTHATPGVLSDTDPPDLRRLRPPPSRSAIFAAYGDPNSALSTRSLPNETSPTTPNTTPSPPSAQPHKRPSLFPWTKSSSSATSLPPTSPSKSLPHVLDSPDNADNGSFNLKSFRHIRPPSPTRSTNGSNASLAAPIPRPRGTSINSDASQRISVAAFREAQARRSMAGSPSPSFRDPSPARGAPARSMTPEDRVGRSSPRPSRSTPSMPKAGVQQRRRSSLAVGTTSESEAETSGEEDSDDETMRSGNRASQLDRFSRPGKARAKSEAGHGGGASSSTFRRNDVPVPQRAPQSHLGHSMAPSRSEVPQSAKQEEIPPRSQSSLSHYGVLRNRASVSTSALTPSAAAQRASALVASNANASPDRVPLGNNPPSRQSTAQAPPPPVQRSSKVADDSDSEDDAPLATLVAPRRPGSAMSSYSSIHSRSTGNVTTRSTHPKPLIDINELTGRKPSLPTKSTAGFTGGHTLLNDNQPTYSSSPLVESPTSAHHEPLTRTVPPVKFVSPPGSPTPGPKQYSLSPESDTRSLESQPKPPTLRRDTSPEQHRDLLTDRLSRVVKLTIQPPTPNTAALQLQTPASPQSQASTSRGVSSISGDTSDSSRKQWSDLPRNETRRPSLSPNPPPTSTDKDPSPPDEDLAELLGSAVKFISRNGEPPDESSESESSDDDHYYEKDKGSGKDRIAPIPIKQRAPPPAFSVTSRPAFPRKESPDKKKSTQEPETKSSPSFITPRPRSTTLNATTPSPAVGSSKGFMRDSTSTTSSSPAPAAGKPTSKSSSTNGDTSPSERSTLRPGPGPGTRQRSSTMLTGIPLSSQMAPRSASHIPEKPFAIRRNSPASSTGDSSSGRAPFTPRDGSDVGTQEEAKEKKRDEWSGGASGLGNKRHVKRRSVSFEDDPEDLKPPNRNHFREGARGSMDGNSSGTEDDREVRRRERRRSEAKAAIELGNIVNGPGPIVSDDDDDMPINQAMSTRMSAVNPMMAMGNSMSMPMGFGTSPSMWNANMSQQMLSPAQFMVPPPADPSFFAAHQQAMMIAKQAYQMAVAQQAMAAAGDEWERGSAIGGFGGGGSVYGGSSGPSMMTPQFGMMNMMQGGGGGGGWPSSASMYGGPARSIYGGSTLSPGAGMMSSSRSEYGGARASAANFSSARSSYGESFGPDVYARKAPASARARPNGRDSGFFPPVPPIPASQNQNGRNSPDGRGAPRSRTTSQPTASPACSAGAIRKAPPPSSWRAGI